MKGFRERFHELKSEVAELHKKLEKLEFDLDRYLTSDEIRINRLIKKEDAAFILSVHPRTIERKAERGEINKYNRDGSVKRTNRNTAVFYDRKEVEAELND